MASGPDSSCLRLALLEALSIDHDLPLMKIYSRVYCIVSVCPING